MIGSRINPSAPQAELDVVEAFKRASTPIISDNLDRLPGAEGLRPYHRGGIMVGTALTILTAAGDNAAIHQALEIVRPADVLIVDGGAATDRALIGEIIVAIAASRGAAGIVVDGAIRDVSSIAAGDFPVFARAVTHRGPYKNGPGRINVPVTIGGMVVNPGDIVVGDADGVVAFPQEIASELLKAVAAQAAREEDILLSIRDGVYAGAYGKLKNA
jgi:RraA family protein